MMLILLWGIGCFIFFQTQFKYHFFYQEQNQLFLYDLGYLLSYFNRPAWLACLIGDFLTQFYYFLYVGPVILTLVLLTLGDLTRRALERTLFVENKKNISNWLAFIIAIVVMTIEARFAISHTYRLGSIIALIGGFGLWFIHNQCSYLLKHWAARVMFIIVFEMLAIWMFGIGALVFIPLELFRLKIFFHSKRRIFEYITCIALAIGLPLFCSIEMSNAFNISQEKALLAPGIGKWVDYESEKVVENNFKLDNEYYFGNYSKVVELYESQQDNATEPMTFYYSLSLAQLGNLPEKLPTMKNPFLGTFITIGEDTPMYHINMINDLYWALGDMTYTERAALLANTFSRDGRNARMMKRLAEANLVSGDTVAANKYLRLLSKTLLYHRWAAEHTPENMSTHARMAIEEKRKYANTTDNIRLGDNCYIILTQLLESNPDNRIALYYLLCSDMLAQNPQQFVADYERYGSGGKSFFTQIYNSAKQ